MAKSSPCFSLMSLYSFSRPSYWGVKPHLEAVFTTRTTFPLKVSRGTSLPFSADLVSGLLKLIS